MLVEQDSLACLFLRSRRCTSSGYRFKTAGAVEGFVMRRREFLEAGAFTALAGLTTGCAARKTTAAAPPPRPGRASINLAPPRISWERVIRTTVGLRPHRDSGFVLKPEKFDAKTVIHDYGFGGAGMSLAWGCGAMAADMALQHGERRAAVLGCGSPGLTAARQLQRRGSDGGRHGVATW
jgi:hypothetical protein